MVIVVADSATHASSGLGSSSNPIDLGATPMMFGKDASNCTSMAWECVASSESHSHPTTVMLRIRAGLEVSNTPEPEVLSDITELDKLQPFVAKKCTQIWVGTAVNHWRAGIQAWGDRDHSAETFKPESVNYFV